MDELLSLIGLFYEAAVDPEVWPVLLGRLDVFFNTAQTFIAIENAVDPSTSLFYGSVVDPIWQKRYAQSYVLLNPMRLAMTGRAKAGDTVLTTDFMTPDEYRSTRFSRELLAERGIVDIAVAILEMTASRITVLSAQRSIAQGFADEDLRRKLELVMPHAQRTVRIAGLLQHHKLAVATLADTLDSLVAAVFLLTKSGIIVHSNTSGAHLLEEQDVVRNVRGRLTLSDRRAGALLSDLIARENEGDDAFGREGQTIALTGPTGRKFIATVLLLAGRRSGFGTSYQAAVAVCIKEAEFEGLRSSHGLAELYDLTRREVTVLMALVEIGGPADIAEVLGITENTVKTHLKAIFRKTGAKRQADLVKLVASAVSPLGGQSL